MIVVELNLPMLRARVAIFCYAIAVELKGESACVTCEVERFVCSLADEPKLWV